MSRKEDFKKAAEEYDDSPDMVQGIIARTGFEFGAEYGYQYALQHPHWIPVEEELPKETGWYLVATPTLNSKIDVALWDRKWHRLITITHWMPMPPAPAKKGGQDDH